MLCILLSYHYDYLFIYKFSINVTLVKECNANVTEHILTQRCLAKRDVILHVVTHRRRAKNKTKIIISNIDKSSCMVLYGRYIRLASLLESHHNQTRPSTFIFTLLIETSSCPRMCSEVNHKL